MSQANAWSGIDRDTMPQVCSVEDMKEILSISGISFREIEHRAVDLRPTQSNIDDAKVEAICSDFKTGKIASFQPIIVSRDMMVLDGHHRWAAMKRLGKSITTLEIDLPWMEALAWIKNN